METASYIQGADLPDLGFELRDEDGNLLQLASGHTFELKVGQPGSAATLMKTTGITGANTAPNVTVAWATSGELNTITPGFYYLDLTVTRTSDSKHRKFRFGLTVNDAIT